MLRNPSVWLAIGFCLPVYVLASTAGLPGAIVLPLTFLASIAGSVAGAVLRSRRASGRASQDEHR